MVSKILSVHARQVLDSRGNPTVEAEVKTEKGVFSAIVPSGASTGSFEALELRDGGKSFGGKSVLKAVENVNKKICPKTLGMNPENQREIDNFLLGIDGTENKSSLGANAILSVSLACARAGAASKGIALFEHLGSIAGNKKFCLPVPQLNVLNGGKHAGLEQDIQEQMFFPSGAKSFSEALQMSVESYHCLGKILKKKFGAQATLLGDEGGFVPPVKSVQERLDFMLEAVSQAGYGGKIEIALDSAASEFFDGSAYHLYGKKYSAGELADFYAGLCKTYPVVSIEDGLAEQDWPGWKELNSKLGKKIQIVGDDLLVTNTTRIERAIEEKSCNALLLKVNQIGTLSESIDASKLASGSGWNVVVSHRSGETEDSFISDLVVGLGCGQSKFGGPARSDRNAKYNQLLRIEDCLGKNAVFGKK